MIIKKRSLDFGKEMGQGINMIIDEKEIERQVRQIITLTNTSEDAIMKIVKYIMQLLGSKK